MGPPFWRFPILWVPILGSDIPGSAIQGYQIRPVHQVADHVRVGDGAPIPLRGRFDQRADCRCVRRLTSLTDQHTSDVEHGPTREVTTAVYSLRWGRCPQSPSRHDTPVHGMMWWSTGAAKAKTAATRRRIWWDLRAQQSRSIRIRWWWWWCNSRGQRPRHRGTAKYGCSYNCGRRKRAIGVQTPDFVDALETASVLMISARRRCGGLSTLFKHTTEDNDDDEMQRAFQAARQFETGQHRSPNYVALASQHGSQAWLVTLGKFSTLGVGAAADGLHLSVQRGTGIDNSPH